MLKDGVGYDSVKPIATVKGGWESTDLAILRHSGAASPRGPLRRSSCDVQVIEKRHFGDGAESTLRAYRSATES